MGRKGERVTFDELKAEAKAQGYKLMPIAPYVKLEPCKCGRKRSQQLWHSQTGKFFKCGYCGFTAAEGKNERDARKLWNCAVSEAT